MKPLYDRISAVGNKNKTRYCMPGHGGKAVGSFADGILKYDLTELPDTDNLWRCDDVIAQAEALAAECFGAESTCFVTTGASTAVKAAIFLTAKNKTVICDRFCHHSAVDGIVLSDATPLWLLGGEQEEFGVPVPPTPRQAEEAFKKHPEAAALFVTSPNYFGLTADIAGLRAVCDRYGAKLVVDNSHGTHLTFIDGGKNHPVKLGAHLCIDSAHKTLPVLTGGALLHGVGIPKARVKEALSLFSSSSPSYLTMASLDFAREYAQDNRDKWAEAVSLADQLRRQLQKGAIPVLSTDDPLRVTVGVGDGEGIYNALYSCGIAPEMYCGGNIVFIIPLSVTAEDINILATKLQMLYNSTDKDKFTPRAQPLPLNLPSQPALPLKTAVFGDKVDLPLADCVGRVSAATVTVYPPSIPVLLPGDRITDRVVEIIEEFTDFKELSALAEKGL